VPLYVIAISYVLLLCVHRPCMPIVAQDNEHSPMNFCVNLESDHHSCCSRPQLAAPLIKCGLCEMVLNKLVDKGCDDISDLCDDLAPVCAFGTLRTVTA